MPDNPGRCTARLALLWQFKGTFRGISVGYEFRIGKAKRRRYLWKRKNCQSSVIRMGRLPASEPAPGADEIVGNAPRRVVPHGGPGTGGMADMLGLVRWCRSV